MTIRKVSHWYDDMSEFTFRQEPIEDTIRIKDIEEGFVVYYLVRDEGYNSPDDWGDNSLFLVHYHRDFEVRKDNIVDKEDIKSWYQGEKILLQKKYHIFQVSSYIHSGVHLSLGRGTQYPDQRWDVSHVGAVLAHKDEFKSKKKAEKAAESLIKEWNMCLSGEVYGLVIETYDKDKKSIDVDAVWGHYGFNETMKELETCFNR